ncbi:DUF998 domain-containing protein [Thermococcus gammatolerans]|uniref:DUF998 domain-containing protein n=1 Tax=Thermococcus gammatolerans (strain DSM 15229 / JCM 11827 / EJ3) TaxID=593117 RepID=C5A1U5_THEGJ|nr:DUF998 domain-containing protein [Thermococcus gammatolerans]ACS34364.1 Conserved hypothetical protein [Thermococcus gammatolerans EJ3]
MERSQLIAGILSPIVGPGGVFAAILIHRSWWRVTENAISDLGKIGLSYNWVMNLGLIISASLGLYYISGLWKELKGALQRMGVVVFAIGLIFLAGIGLFPEGTGPHYYVSWGFFVACSIGMLLIGIGLYFQGEKTLGLLAFAIFTVGWILALWAKSHFRGVAVAEFVGVFGIVIWHYALLKRFLLPKA